MSVSEPLQPIPCCFLLINAGAQVRLVITVNAAYTSVVNRIAQFMSDLDSELAAAAGLPQAGVRTTSVTAGKLLNVMQRL
jgi:hypothetical protein